MKRNLCPLLSLLLVLLAAESQGYETDQYLNRAHPVKDSLAAMDQRVNLALQRILHSKRPPRTKKQVMFDIYFEIGGWYWADKIERWAMKSDAVEKYPQRRYSSIYSGMPPWATRVSFVFGVGRSIRVNNVMIGSDKFGHFVSQGFKYFRRHLRGLSERRILKRGRFAERWIFGQFTTGVFSNADLVANYEGYLFYQSLFTDNIIPGKPAILVWRDGRYHQQRPFTWADHINPYWDEALNPSYNVRSLDKRLRKRIKALCPAYWAAPEHYAIPGDAALWARYEHIGMKDARQNRFGAICGPAPAASREAAAPFR